MKLKLESEQTSLDNKKQHSKTEEQLFRVFSLKNNTVLKKDETNKAVEQYINQSFKDSDGGLGKSIKTPNSVENFKNTSIDYITKYCHDLGIYLPKNLKDNIHITLHEGSDTFHGITIGNSIKINNSVYNKLPLESKIKLIVHELLHIIGTKLNKMYYDYTYDKIDDKVEIGKITYGKHTGYTNTFVGGHSNTRLGEGFNEGFTEMISLGILNKNGRNTSGLIQSFYINYIYIIDYLLIELSKKTGQSYEDLLTYLIQGNILGDAHYLNIISTNLGKNFLADLLHLGFNDVITGKTMLEAQIRHFTKKYKHIYFSQNLSQNMQKFIGDKYTYQSE